MSFLIQSLIASVILTVLINLLPRFFPTQTRKVERSLHDKIEAALNEDDERRGQGGKPRVKVFFPWQAMLILSVILTVLVNVVGLFLSR